MRRYEAVPHPYVVDAPGASAFERLDAGAQVTIALTLVGRAATALEAVLAAFDFAARAGLGRGRERGRARLIDLRAVWRGGAPDVVVFDAFSGFRPVAPEIPLLPECPARLRVTLATPLRLVREGKLIGPKLFPPAALVANLVRRVSMMCEFFGDSPLDTDFRALKEMWERLVASEPMLAAADQMYWSSRNQKELDMGGVIGSLVLDMAGAEALFPYLWLGQWVHAGKGAVMGMGAIRVRPATAPS